MAACFGDDDFTKEINELEKMKAERQKELQILMKQKGQEINKDIVDPTARELELIYRTKELEAMQAKLAFYVYTRNAIHAKRLHLK